jgi:hypothetical protein
MSKPQFKIYCFFTKLIKIEDHYRNLIKTIMKKLIFISALIFVALPIFMTSCEKDTPLNEAIIGKWQVESITQVTYEDNVKKSSVTYYLDAGEMAFEFAEGGGGIYYENNDINGMFSWSLNGSALTLSGGGTPWIWTVTNDKDALTWSYSETEVGDTTTYKYEYFYTAKKVDE